MLRLSNSQKQSLLEIARRSVEASLAIRPLGWTPEPGVPVWEQYGVFVSIHKHGELRGCIGRLQIDDTLVVATAECAVSAAFADPRFHPMSLDELDVVTFEVSVLSPLEPIDDVGAVQVGTHGILIEKNGQRGLLLPQVATKYDWDRTEFLEQTSIKAGLEPDAWRSGATMSVFQPVVFEEGAV
jgi:AmmeMemoRadiSam system protein A